MNIANNKVLTSKATLSGAKRAGSYFKRQLENNARGSNWLHKDINPTLSFMILAIVLLSVFLMGAYFMKEYIKAWNIVSERTNIESYGTRTDKLLLP